MSQYRGRTISLWEDRGLATAKAAFVIQRGAEEIPARAAAIAAVPSKDWRGRTVYRVECEGPFGNGPHEVWLPERVLWQLIDFRNYRCAYHQ